MTTSIALCLQFHKGDIEAAFDLAELLADMEPDYLPNVSFVLFAARNVMEVKNHHRLNDVKLKLSRKFRTYVWDSVSRGDGYPHGPNDMWYEINQRCFLAKRNGDLNADIMFTFEADTCPTQKGWIPRLLAEYDACGKQVLGCITSYNGEIDGMHVNGNMVLPVDFCYNHKLISCPADIAWDVYHRHVFVGDGAHSRLIWNEYLCKEEKMDQYLNNPKSLPLILHGYKGAKLREYVRKTHLQVAS